MTAILERKGGAEQENAANHNSVQNRTKPCLYVVHLWVLSILVCLFLRMPTTIFSSTSPIHSLVNVTITCTVPACFDLHWVFCLHCATVCTLIVCTDCLQCSLWNCVLHYNCNSNCSCSVSSLSCTLASSRRTFCHLGRTLLPPRKGHLPSPSSFSFHIFHNFSSQIAFKCCSFHCKG